MKKIATLSAVLFLFRFSTLFAGEPIESSKAVVAPPAPPPPESLYRNHEWQVDLFGT